MPELLEQEEGQEEFDAKAAEREESRRLRGVAKEIDETVSFPMLGALQLITSLFDRPVTKSKEEQENGGENERE